MQNKDKYISKEDKGSLHEDLEHVQDITEDKKVKEAILKREKEISALLKASRAVLKYSDFTTSSKAIFDACTELIGAPAGYVALLTPDKKENHVVFLNTGDYICTVDPDLSMPIRGMRGEVVKSKKPLYNNSFQETDWLRLMPKGHGFLENVLFTPLLINDEVQGLMGMANKPGGFTEEDVKLAMAFTEFVSIALQNSQTLESLEDSEQKYKNLSQELEQIVIERTKKLKESEASYRRLSNELEVILDHIPGIVAFKDTENNLLRVNKFLADAHNLKKAEMENRSAFNFYPRDIAQNYWEDDLEVINSKKPKLNIVEPWETDAGKRWVNTSKIPYIDENGNVKGIIAMAFDITERMLAEEKLKESEEKFSKAFHSSPNLMAITRMEDGYFLDVNETYIQTLGYSREELIGHSSIELNLWVNSDQRNEFTKKITEDKYIQAFDVDVYTKSGKILTMLFSGDVIYLNNIPHLITSANDITERRKAEQKVKDSEVALQESEEILKKAQSISHIGHFKLDPITLEVSGSDELFNIFGLSQDEATLKAFTEVVHPEDREYDLYHIRRGIEFGESWDIEHRLLLKNGVVKWVHTIGETTQDETGKVVVVLGIVQDISERKKTEKLLQKRAHQWQTTFDAMSESVFLLDLDRKIVQCNKATFEMLGKSNENEIIGHSCYELVHSTSEPVPWCPLQRMFETKQRETSVTKLGDKWFEISTDPVFNEEQVLTGAVHIITDITENKNGIQKLQESEEKYRLLFENMNTGFAYHEVLVDDNNKPIDYRYIEANIQFEKLTGLKISELIGKTVTEVLPGIENDPADWIGRYGKVGLTGEPLILEDYSEQLDRWYKVSGYSPKKGFFAVSFSDITDRKRNEKKLKESEEKYRHLFETSPYFVGLLDNKGILIDCNTSIYKFLSTHIKEDLIGKHFREIFLLNEKNEYLIPLFEKVFKDTLKGNNTEPIDFQLYRSSRGYFWLHVQGSIIELEQQKLVQFFIQDISERKKAELIIQNEITKLRELDGLKNEFIVRTSHELKTPLVSICGSADFLLNYMKDDFSMKSRAHLETINSGGKRLRKLVDNLLDILSIESRKFELNVEKVNLSNIITKCISDLQYLATERDITISTSIQHAFYVRVDGVKIEQVFVNLLSNALKNTPHYGQISFSSEKAQGYINTKISDTGTGFTEEEKIRIFEKFGKIEKYGKGMDIITEGSGLGLYLSKEIVELHGGKIWLESEGRNKGSTFIVSLPKDEK